MKSFIKFLMGIAVFFTAVTTVLAYLKKITTEQKYIVVDENREELF